MDHKFLFPFSDSEFTRPARVAYQHGGAAPAGAEHDDEEEEEHGGTHPAPQRGGPAAHVAEGANRRVRAIGDHPELPTNVQRLARQAARSESPVQRYYVDQLLRGELEPERFVRQIEQQETREQSWGTIFNVQRHIRRRIDELHERAESYLEVIPSERLQFRGYLKQIGDVNLRDASVDGELKDVLHGLANEASAEASARQGHPAIPAVLSQESARKIYELDPTQPGFEKSFQKLTAPLRRQTGNQAADRHGQQMYARLLELKEEERKIEKQFGYLYDGFQKIINRNLSRVTLISLEKKMLENATRATGITIKPGTVIRFQDPEILGLAGRTQTTRIQDIGFDRVPLFDHQGKIVSYTIGAPIIRVNGMKMRLGRFKKWVDATNAVEDVSSLHEVEECIGWNMLGMKLKPGTELEYQKISADRNGLLERCPEHVSVREVKDGHVVFSRPIAYQTGPFVEGRGVTTENRESLEFGEFVKWYHRNEVEQALSMADLRQSLEEYNHNFNRIFGVSQKNNPPISIFPHETLYYPDGSGIKFTIENVGHDKITLNNGMTYTPAQFLYWVRNNHVQHEPVKQPVKTREELENERKKQEHEEHEKLETERRKHKLAHEKEHRLKMYDSRESLGFGGYMKKVWFSTTILSFKDIFNFAVSIKDFIKRKHERRSKGRYSEVGSHLPWILGTEFERIKQSAENEEVHQYTEAMEHWGIFQVKETLHRTNDKDEAKACIETLMKKGEMRFDDHLFWETLNRLTSRYTTRGAELAIPHLEHMPFGMNGEDMTYAAMDALWGQGTGSEWFQKNISTYNNNKKSFEYKGKQLEADPKSTGGLRGELHRLLKDWKKGEYVNPQEYEELIDFGIKYGKMSAEEKMFFLIMGVITPNEKMGGETLLHLDRAGQFNGDYLNIFPLLDFFTNKNGHRPFDNTTGPWRTEDYRYWAENHFPNDMQACKAGVEFTKFLWDIMVFDDAFRIRLSKGLRNAENMDHDDAHLFVPTTSMQEIDNITESPAGGTKKFFTPEGYANVYPGFNQYFIAIATKNWAEDEAGKRQQFLKDAIKSFVRYDAILDYRYKKKDGERKARLSEQHYNRRCVVDDTVNLGLHQKQLQNLILSCGRAYGTDVSYLFKKTGPWSDPHAQREQIELEKLHDKFIAEVIEGWFKIDGGKRIMEEIVKAKESTADSPRGLRGMRGWTMGRDQASAEGINKAKELKIL